MSDRNAGGPQTVGISYVVQPNDRHSHRLVSINGCVKGVGSWYALLAGTLSAAPQDLTADQIAACANMGLPIEQVGKTSKWRTTADLKLGPHFYEVEVLAPRQLPPVGYAGRRWAQGQHPEYVEWD